jgi:hypothetical protein
MRCLYALCAIGRDIWRHVISDDPYKVGLRCEEGAMQKQEKNEPMFHEEPLKR